MASLYSALFIHACISLLLPSHVAEYYATTAYVSRENCKGTDFITNGLFVSMVCHFVLWWVIGHPVCGMLTKTKVVIQDESPTSSRDVQKLDTWLKGFEAIDPILHTINCASKVSGLQFCINF